MNQIIELRRLKQAVYRANRELEKKGILEVKEPGRRGRDLKGFRWTALFNIGEN